MLRAAFVNLFIVVVLHSAFIGSSCNAQNPATGGPFEVRLSIECFDYNRLAWSPLGFLHPRDFRASENQLTFPVSLLQPALKQGRQNRPIVPTRLLTILDDSTLSSVAGTERLLQSLEPAFRRNWDVGVLASGRFTGYASSEQALRTLLASPANSQEPAASAPILSKELINFRGRRVLLYVPGPSQRAGRGDFPQSLIDATDQIMLDRYIVDGGLLNSYHSPHKVQDACALLMSYDDGRSRFYRNADFPPLPNSHPLSALVDGIYHEVDLRGAIEGMTHDAAGFYDLQIGCAGTRCPDRAGPLFIQIRKDEPLTINYEGFGQAQDAAIQVTVRR